MTFQILLLLIIVIAISIIKGWVFETKRKQRRDYYRNDYLKSEAWKRKRYVVLKRDNWRAYIAVVGRHKYIIRDTQNTILGKSQSNGLFQYANLVMTKNIIDRVRCRTHNTRFCKKRA